MYVASSTQIAMFFSLAEWTDAGGEKTFVHTIPQFFQGFAFGILLSGIIPMLVAGIIGYGILGLRGHYFAICTLALRNCRRRDCWWDRNYWCRSRNDSSCLAKRIWIK